MAIVCRAWANLFAILSVLLRVISPWLSDLTQHVGGRAKVCSYEPECASLHAPAHPHASVYPDEERNEDERVEDAADVPPHLPPGRGMTYAMEQPEAAYWRSHSAVWSSLPQFHNAALLGKA
jgi:hypothetical protein